MPRKRDNNKETRDSGDNLLYFEARSEKQAQAIEIFEENDLVFLLGPAGSGKTHCAVYLAMREMMRHNIRDRRRVEKIVITRPIVEAGEHLGALPGEVNEKVHPYMIPIYDCINKITGNGKKFADEHLEIAPLAFMRGRSFEHCVAILDEAQNCTAKQLLLYMTRLGIGGKMLISGDLAQSDINSNSGLHRWVTALKGAPGVGIIEFTDSDIVRHPLVRTILARQPR